MTNPALYVNDRPSPWAPGKTVLAVLGEWSLAERKGIAVAVNGAVVPRSQWPKRSLEAEDRIVVIQATQGG
jgi:sulfur carrier protein